MPYLQLHAWYAPFIPTPARGEMIERHEGNHWKYLSSRPAVEGKAGIKFED